MVEETFMKDDDMYWGEIMIVSGAMLIGEKESCDEARVWLRTFGGNVYHITIGSWFLGWLLKNVSDGNIKIWKESIGAEDTIIE